MTFPAVHCVAVVVCTFPFWFDLQGELTAREVSSHNQKLALESVMKELDDTKQTIDRFRCGFLSDNFFYLH